MSTKSKPKSKIVSGHVHGGRLYLKKGFRRDHGIKNGSFVTIKLLEVIPPEKEDGEEA